MAATYKGTLFSNKAPAVKEQKSDEINVEQLIYFEAQRLADKYGSDCLDVDQLKKALNVGKSNAYKIMNKELPYKLIGKRKVVPAIELARWLINKS